MAIDPYSTRMLLRSYEQLPPARSFLRDTFFKNVVLSTGESVDIDIVKGKRRVAAYVSHLEPGHMRKKEGYDTKTYRPPYIKEKREVTTADVGNRKPGVDIYSNPDQAQIVTEELAKLQMEIDEERIRAEEVQAAQALFTGEVVLRNNEKVTFPMRDTHKITLASDYWNNDNTDIIKQLRTWRRMLIQDGSLAPNVIIAGSDAIDALIGNAGIKGTGGLSPIKIDRGMINPEVYPDGVTYWGYLKDVACDVWSYDEWYLPNGSDTESSMVPAKKIFMGSTKARMDRCYGKIKDLKSSLRAQEIFWKSWEEEDPSVRWIMGQSSPLLVPHAVDTYLFAQVLAS